LPKEGPFETSLEDQRAFLERFLDPLLREMRAAQPDLRLYWMMGNDDWAGNMDWMEQWHGEELAWLLPDHVYDLDDGLQLTGDPYVSLTPFSLKDWERFDDAAQTLDRPSYLPCLSTSEGLQPTTYEELRARGTLRERLAALAARTGPARTIYVFHDPPHGTSLDRLWNDVSVGSRAIRDFILEHQPPLTLHGHIPEAPLVTGRWHDWLGQTLCINPGPMGSVLHSVTFETADPVGTMRHSVYGSAPETPHSSP